MKEIILIKNGEIALKGLNRNLFEDALMKHLRQRLKPLGGVQIRKAQSTMVIEPTDDAFDFEEAVDRVSKVFGVSAFSRACVAEKTVEDIKAKAGENLADLLRGAKTFKVECKRSDKSFP